MSMAPGYRIETVPDKGMIRMIMIGFWDDATVTAFAAELDLAIKKLADAGIRPGEYLYFVSYRDSGTQSHAVTERFEQLLTRVGPLGRRFATISPTTLLKVQLNRLASDKRFRTFMVGQEAEAEAWLLERETVVKPV